jgi:maltose alpha-D-glucosyltransferase/alpha-amylase
MLAITNLADEKAVVDLGPHGTQDGVPTEVFADHDYPPVGADLNGIELGPYGYRWLRLRRTIGARSGSARSPGGPRR